MTACRPGICNARIDGWNDIASGRGERGHARRKDESSLLG
jgi:hypothetical protein